MKKTQQERNVDKIKRLEKELAAEREKRHHADIEIIRMHKVVNEERKNAVEQLNEVSVLADGLLAALALHHGSNVGDGVWEIGLPSYSPSEMVKRFKVTTEHNGVRYIIRIQPRGEDYV